MYFFNGLTVRVESNLRSDIHVTVWMLVRNILVLVWTLFNAGATFLQCPIR